MILQPTQHRAANDSERSRTGRWPLSYIRCARRSLADLVDGRSSPCELPVRHVAIERVRSNPKREASSGEPASRSASKPDSASLRKWCLVSQPMWLKPVTGEVQTDVSATGALGVVGGSAQGKIGRGTWEARLWGCGESHGCRREYITEGGPQTGSRRGP